MRDDQLLAAQKLQRGLQSPAHARGKGARGGYGHGQTAINRGICRQAVQQWRPPLNSCFRHRLFHHIDNRAASAHTQHPASPHFELGRTLAGAELQGGDMLGHVAEVTGVYTLRP